jgi:hypothetical protein
MLKMAAFHSAHLAAFDRPLTVGTAVLSVRACFESAVIAVFHCQFTILMG